jgi:hypothetical protein
MNIEVCIMCCAAKAFPNSWDYWINYLDSPGNNAGGETCGSHTGNGEENDRRLNRQEAWELIKLNWIFPQIWRWAKEGMGKNCRMLGWKKKEMS